MERGIQIGRDKLFDFMRQERLLTYRKKRCHKTTNSNHRNRKYPNKIRDMTIHRPEQVWVADITYLKACNRHYYLHLVTDAYSKKIMGYQLSSTMEALHTSRALQQATKNRMHKRQDEELIHHSDRGIQYCSREYVQLLHENNIEISMTEQSDPYENAIAERVNGILKSEFGLDEEFQSYLSLKKQVDESIDLYNKYRPHYSLDYMTPHSAHKQRHLKIKTYKKHFIDKPTKRKFQMS